MSRHRYCLVDEGVVHCVISTASMPLAHNLNKVSKNVLLSNGQLHMKGRKYKQLQRATLRHQKLIQKKITTNERKEKQLGLTLFIKNKITDEDKRSYSLDEMKSFVKDYVYRYSGEIEKLQRERRPGRPKSSRQQKLETLQTSDEQTFLSGYIVPDLSDEANVLRLRAWNGTTGGVTSIRHVKICKDLTDIPGADCSMD